MSGKELDELLGFYDLSTNDASRLLGVHLSTIYRWRQQGKIVADRLQMEILSVLDHLRKMGDSGDMSKPKFALKNALMLRGGLYGLYLLLGKFFKE
jgi:hypothetical protein